MATEHAHVQPARYTLACADGNDYLTGLAWTSWGPRLASATGTEHVNDCIPYCAAGHFHSYPVNVVVWGSTAAGPGRQRYTRITELYPGVHPPYVRSQPGYLLGDAVPMTATRRMLPNELAP